jgi:hypothetical protein
MTLLCTLVIYCVISWALMTGLIWYRVRHEPWAFRTKNWIEDYLAAGLVILLAPGLFFIFVFMAVFFFWSEGWKGR